MEIVPADLARWSVSQLNYTLPDGSKKEQLAAVATEFEALFVKQMLDSMRSTLAPEESLFYGGMAQDIFEDMLYDEYARVIAKSGTLGIADIISRTYDGTVS